MRRALIVGLTLALGGCGGGGDFTDLQAFMDEVRAAPKGKMDPEPVFEGYEAFTYKSASLRSPFQPFVRIDETQKQKNGKKVTPDLSRVRQFLEGFNIETFNMVGTLKKDDQLFALVKGGGGVHRVKVGDYLGRNHGRITAISEGEINVIEIVPDGDGEWLERPRTLPLQDSKTAQSKSG